MNYIQHIAAKIKSVVPKEKLPEAQNVDTLFEMYAVLLLAKGQSVTREDVHDAWSAWMTQTNDKHKSIKPFAELSNDVQMEDEPYVAAIKKVWQTIETKRLKQ